MELWTNEIWLWAGLSGVMLHKYKTAQFCCIRSDCWNHQLSLKTEDFWFILATSVCECERAFERHDGNHLCESPPPLDTQSSLYGRQQLAALATHTKIIVKEPQQKQEQSLSPELQLTHTAGPSDRLITSKTPCQDPSDSTAHSPSLSLITGQERREREER